MWAERQTWRTGPSEPYIMTEKGMGDNRPMEAGPNDACTPAAPVSTTESVIPVKDADDSYTWDL
jgi:hypothetical protein